MQIGERYRHPQSIDTEIKVVQIKKDPNCEKCIGVLWFHKNGWLCDGRIEWYSKRDLLGFKKIQRQ